MATVEPEDPREWLRQEEQAIAKTRRKFERAQTRTSAIALMLWGLAFVVACGVILVVTEIYRNRRTVVKYLLK